MSTSDRENDRYTTERHYRILQKKYSSLLDRRGGIFSTQVRSKLVGLNSVKHEAQFRLRVRSNVKAALEDLRLFLEASPGSQVKQVLTPEELDGLLQILLEEPFGQAWRFFNEEEKNPSDFRFVLAARLVEAGLACLLSQGVIQTDSHRRVASEVADLLRFYQKTKGQSSAYPNEIFNVEKLQVR